MTSTITEMVLALSSRTELATISKATLILMVGLVAAALARRHAASLRHTVLAATFGALLLLPMAVLVAPDFAVGVPVYRAAPLSLDAAVATPPTSPLVRSGALPESSPFPFPSLPSWTSLLQFVWLAGTLSFLAPIAAGFWRMRRLRRNGLPSPELSRFLRGLTSEAAVRRPVELLLHDDIPAPLTWGLASPVIFLPCSAKTWSTGELRRALIHELEHVRRADWAVQLAARLACAGFWFHPLAWLAWDRLSLEAERACDDAVLRTEDGTDYADQLVTLASQFPGGALGPALGMAHRSNLAVRVSAILDAGQSRGRASLLTTLLTFTAALMAVIAVAPVRAVAQATPQSQDSDTSDLAELLIKAAEKGDNARVEKLLSLGASVNAKLDGDGTALIAAARKGRDSTVQLLMDRGAQANIGVEGDGSPLIMAARNGHLSTVRLLLDRGADIHMPVPGDGNPLIMAARGGNLEVVRYLLDHGAKIEQIVPGDENALIESSASGHLEIVRFLVSRGANVNSRVQTEEGEWRTPLNMARKRGHDAVAAFLQSAGARE